ncbi:DNA-binding protein [Paenibacillus lactis]|uniref:DNA-binding protein n=1 Tax=Paenibacillus lactis TaxID=228574 RepID=A0ABS4F9W7_9BACL|nr:DNA-binding protein [Paenibacillus lactis]MBP1893034.1 hypothetical protein [Paenibacillus lactis]HAF97503.1 hypothetical protein [Paenibacillus lactis]
MAVVVIEVEDLQKMIREAVADAVKGHLTRELPPVLTRTQFMELLGIGESKTAELFNRPDFPVNREFGHPRIPTGLLLKWIDEHTSWVNQNAGEQWKKKRNGGVA